MPPPAASLRSARLIPTIHATAVALGGRAVLLIGAPGCGKSDLALRLIDRGWRLVADDRAVLTRHGEALVARAPPVLDGLIEVRGVGIVNEPAAPAPVAMVFDLSAPPDRLPDPATWTHDGITVPRLALAAFEASAPIKIERALRTLAAGVEAAAVDLSAQAATPAAPAAPPMLVVTGMSGAGRSTALKALEDLDYEVVDNLPLGLVESLLHTAAAGDAPERPLAFGIDTRTRAFDAEALVARLRALRGEGVDIRLLYFDCSDECLTQRFSETRRRHPLAADRPAADGIDRERILTAPLRRWADMVIDTTDLSAADLRRQIGQRFGAAGQGALTIAILSFGYAHGLPRDADLVFDMRFLANPHWEIALRPLTGEDAAVAAFVAADAAWDPAVDRIADLLGVLLPGYGREGKAYLTIAFGCTGGRHRSVAVAREIDRRLKALGYAPLLIHRDSAKLGGDAAMLKAAPEAELDMGVNDGLAA